MDAKSLTDLQNDNNNKTTGRILVTGVSHIKELPCDEIWQIMRGGPDIDGTIRVRALAPGDNLFHQYIDRWKDADPEEWWHLYEQQFINELNREIIRRLVSLVNSGKTIVLFCFCRNIHYCHRLIVARILEEQGVSVEVYEPAQPDRPKPDSRQLTLDEFLQQ